MEPRWKAPSRQLNWQFIGHIGQFDLWARPHMIIPTWTVGLLVDEKGATYTIDNKRVFGDVLTKDEEVAVMAMLALS